MYDKMMYFGAKNHFYFESCQIQFFC